MCGRYTLSTPGDLLAAAFALEETPNVLPRYNIAPTQEAPVVRLDEGRRRRVDLLKWGLVPHWATDPSIGSRMINARAETAASKPAFRESFRRWRCLVPADGFYEWRREGDRKQPYLLRLPDGSPFAFAGLWSRWQREEHPVLESFTLLTCEPSDSVKSFHDSMPVILAPDACRRWLDPSAGADDLQGLLVPFREALQAIPVSTWVNSPSHEGPRCVEPLRDPPSQR
jgi:putative SOS response-associated peptidase YedK